MTVPNPERAIIAVEKLTEYLLDMSHKRGAAKARLLLGAGYRPDAPRLLESVRRAQHLSLDLTRTSENAYGVVSEIEGPITCRSHPSNWFQLANVRVTIFSSALSDGAK